MKGYLKRTRHWIVLLLFTDLVFIFSTWIIRREAIRYMALFFLLFTALILAVGFCLELYKRRRDEAALLQFLETPDDRGLERISERFGYSEAVRRLCARILSDQALLNEKTVELSEYQDYIEAWVHEVKTSLSLSTLVMSNHKEEMSALRLCAPALRPASDQRSCGTDSCLCPYAGRSSRSQIHPVSS